MLEITNKLKMQILKIESSLCKIVYVNFRLLIALPLTIISTECECLAGVTQVKVPESSFDAWFIVNLYSSCGFLSESVAHPSG